MTYHATRIADDPEIKFFNSQDVKTLLAHIGFAPRKTDPSKWQKEATTYSVFKGRTGAWLATDVHSRQTSGVVQLARNELGLSFGQARIYLRSLFGDITTPSSKPTQATATTATAEKTSPISSSPNQNTNHTADPEKLTEAYLLERYHSNKSYDPAEHPDILSERGLHYIKPEHHFSFRVSRNGSIVFPAYAFDGEKFGRMCGLETRSADGKKYFVKGGSAGVWVSNMPSSDGVLLVAESPYDALAIDVTRHLRGGAMLAAVRSGAEGHLATLIVHLVNEGMLHTIFISTDNDAAGLAYAAKVMHAIEEARRKGTMTGDLRLEYVPPGYAPRSTYINDPNDDLKSILSSNPSAAKKFLDLRRGHAEDESGSSTTDLEPGDYWGYLSARSSN